MSVLPGLLGTPDHHGRYDYSAIVDRPNFTWPGGARLAIHIDVNVEWFAFDDAGGAVLASRNPVPDVLNYAWRDYGNRVGLWRMLALLDELELPAAALLNAAVTEHAPRIVEAFAARGDEFVAHGHTNSDEPGEMSKRGERSVIERSRDALRDVTGAAPKGYLAPLISESAHTPDLLDAAGFEYLLDWAHDEQPVWFETDRSEGGAGRILSVPYPQELNDVPQIMGRRREGAEFADMIRSAYGVHREECEARPVVMGIALHPYLMGQAHRFAHLAAVLRELREKADDKVWFTTPGAISDHFRGLHLA
ncbi:polysaccharide deacetylase [Hasllibacter halocynthiae]|uniref:Chitooligosaccharide deacetylase n=1 Tax=Hasllibacter halocynthiae TaxID=595589 RepID=A0A2T0X9Z8_9RHOB|nr:polysaccharide deacetylase family protein [Hasllibacter halocynthiae]PRY95766.1 polysaccharide deacetylase [Hasllibacter halocynthiae]